jgi:molybdate transport system substrate-binding protein
LDLNLLSAGAAKGLVEAMQAPFHAETGAGISGTFGAVGTIREQFLASIQCDVVILTEAILADLAQSGEVVRATIAPLGRVLTGIAVRSGQPCPPIADRAALRETLAAATALYCPDPERATAGIHFVKVLRELDLWRDVAPRLRSYPSGAVAMGELARTQEPGLVGCTQVTEILYTPGVVLVGSLPAEFELATLYSAAVSSRARHPQLARRLVEMLAGPTAARLRAAGGFSPAAKC